MGRMGDAGPDMVVFRDEATEEEIATRYMNTVPHLDWQVGFIGNGTTYKVERVKPVFEDWSCGKAVRTGCVYHVYLSEV